MTQRFVIVGAGGVGGWLATGLAHFLEFRAPGSALLIVDGDHFEQRNHERQDFVGYGNKADVRAAELQPRFPNTMILPIPAWVVANDAPVVTAEADEDAPAGRIAVGELLQDGDVVFPVVDNFAARKLVFDAAHALRNIDVISAGNDDGLYASLYHYRRRDGIDVTDHPVIMHADDYQNPPDRNPGELSCSERAKLEGGHQLLVANMQAAVLILRQVHLHIFDAPDAPIVDAELCVDLATAAMAGFNRDADPDSRARTTAVITHTHEKVSSSS